MLLVLNTCPSGSFVNENIAAMRDLRLGPATVDTGNGVNVGSLVEDGSVEGDFEGRGKLSGTNSPLRLSTRSCCSLTTSRSNRGVKTKKSESEILALPWPNPLN